MEPTDDLAVEAALEAERQFVLTLGGYALEIPGATLVTHEKIPVPRFNFVQEIGVGAERQAAFFERALDHYFQRALRPTFRVPEPVAEHVRAGLLRLGFSPRPDPLVLLLNGTGPRPGADPELEVRPARRSELDLIASFWTVEGERPEFRSALDVAWAHPNPHERLQPVLACAGDEAVSAALVYRYRSTAGIHAVATRPSARGQGAASDLVRWTVAHAPAGPVARYSLFSDSPRLERRLVSLGFRPARTFWEFDLPATAELSLPPVPPVGPPSWRPPGRRGGSVPPTR